MYGTVRISAVRTAASKHRARHPSPKASPHLMWCGLRRSLRVEITVLVLVARTSKATAASHQMILGEI